MPKIGVTGTGSLIGQAIIKSIIRGKYASESIVGFDYFEETVGSQWCDGNYILPDLLLKSVSNEDWLSFLIKIIIDEKIEILFVGVDFELPILALHKNIIEKNTKCKILVSRGEAIDIGNDKYLTYKFLKDNNLPCPDTWLPNQVLETDLNFPVIVKPRRGYRSRHVYVVHSMDELKSKLSIVEEPIVQELIGSKNTEYTCGIISFDGLEVRSIAINRSLKEGNTFVSEFSKNVPEILEEYLSQVAKKLKPNGVVNFQLRMDKDGVPKIFEINPRNSGTTYIRTLFGFKEVEYVIDLFNSGIPEPFELKEGRVMRYFEEKVI